MDLELGRDRPDQAGQAEVLHDDGIDAGRRDLPHRRFQVGQLGGEDQRIERHISLDAPSMEEGHDLGQVGDVEVVGAHPRVVAGEAEVDGIRPVLHRGEQAGPIARRREQLGLRTGRRPGWLPFGS